MALNDTNYPATTYESDPNAPWNQQPEHVCEECQYCSQIIDFDGNDLRISEIKSTLGKKPITDEIAVHVCIIGPMEDGLPTVNRIAPNQEACDCWKER